MDTVLNEGTTPATPTKAPQHPSTHLPFSSPSSVSSLDSPSKGSGKRKAQPRKRIIIDDDQGSVSYMEEMTASTSKEEEEKEKEGSMPSFSDDPVELLNRLNQFLGEAAMHQLLTASAEVTPAGATSLDAASFSALLSGSATSPTAAAAAAADGVHPMLQAAALAGIQNTPLGSLLSPSVANRLPPKEKNDELSCSPPDSETLSLAINAALTPAQNARTLTLKRKLFDNNKEAMRAAIASISHEERVDLDDLENFAQQFKKQRIKFGFTQGDVGQALGKRYGTDFSQTTISRFEALNLSFKNMCKLRPLLKEWLAEAELAMANGATAADLLERPPPGIKQTTPVSGEDGMGEVMQDGMMYNNGLKKRRKRTNLDNTQKMQLDDEFDKNPRPNHNRMSEIANMLDLDRDVVRVWFCNRRQKVRKLEDERLTFEGATLAVTTLGEALGREMVEREEEGKMEGEEMEKETIPVESLPLATLDSPIDDDEMKKPKMEDVMPSPLHISSPSS